MSQHNHTHEWVYGDYSATPTDPTAPATAAYTVYCQARKIGQLVRLEGTRMRFERKPEISWFDPDLIGMAEGVFMLGYLIVVYTPRKAARKESGV